jgi:hypothetical protein
MGGPAGTPVDQPLNVQDLGIMLASGFAHVLPVGVDHLLFLLGLSLLIVSVKKLVAAVTRIHPCALHQFVGVVVQNYRTAPAANRAGYFGHHCMARSCSVGA